MESVLRWSDEEFEKMVSELELRPLLDMISTLQSTMTTEQNVFDDLSFRLNKCQDDCERRRLSAQLCLSQARLAKLCSRNMYCFTRQQANRGVNQARDHQDTCISVDDILRNVRDMRLSSTKTNIIQKITMNSEQIPEVPRPITCSSGSASDDYDSLDDDHSETRVVVEEAEDDDDDGRTPSPDYDEDDDDMDSEYLECDTSGISRGLGVIAEEEEEDEEEEMFGDTDAKFTLPTSNNEIPNSPDTSSTVPVASDNGHNGHAGTGSEDSSAKESGSSWSSCASSEKAWGSFSNGSDAGMGLGQKKRIRPKLAPDLFGANVNGTSSPKDNGTDIEHRCNEVDSGKPQQQQQKKMNGETIPSIIDQFTNVHEDIVRTPAFTDMNWNPVELLEELYTVREPDAYPTEETVSYVNIEGYLEKLPSGRRKATFWNAWKRRYFRAKDGYLFYYQNQKMEKASLCIQLMGGKIDWMDGSVLGIDDGKGHYVVVRCGGRNETERWKKALLTHTAENYALTYVHPLPAHPHFYEDVVIIDLGSCSVRAGILCSQPTLPQVFFPTVCATDRETGHRVFGSSALEPRVRCRGSLSFPLRPSPKVTKYSVEVDTVHGLLDHVFGLLGVDPKQYEVQISLPRTFPVSLQSAVVKLLIEEFGVAAVNLASQSVLALFSYNATSGVVVDIGERMDVIPIVDGYVIEPGVSRIPYGGGRIVDHLRHFLHQKNYSLVTDAESYVVRYVVERLCYCAENYTRELRRYIQNPANVEEAVSVGRFFDCPSRIEEVVLDSGRFQAPEGLFSPEAWGLDHPGIHKLVHKAIQECGLDVRKEMARSIYLSGGVTMLPGFVERLTAELDRVTPPSVTPKVHASAYRNHAAYLGACVLASSPGFHQAKISREDWRRGGANSLKKWHL